MLLTGTVCAAPRDVRLGATMRPLSGLRLGQYDPERDIFTRELSESEDVAQTSLSLTEAQSLRRDNGDIANLVDTGDLVTTCARRRCGSATFVCRGLRPEVLELEELPGKRLRCICRSYGLSSTGRKREMIERIVEYEAQHEAVSRWRRPTPSIKQVLLEIT